MGKSQKDEKFTTKNRKRRKLFGIINYQYMETLIKQ